MNANEFYKIESLYSIPNAHQHGFRLQYSTITAKTELLDNKTTILNNKQSTLALFTDAFNSYDHSILLHKLEAYGFQGNNLDWFKDYLTNRFQYIDILGNRFNVQVHSI